MMRFLEGLVPRVAGTAVGETLLVPLHLCHADGEAEAVLLGCQRRSDGPHGRFTFAVVAGGPSLAYHATRVGEATAAFEQHAAIVLEHVPEQVLDVAGSISHPLRVRCASPHAHV